jgi:hypothetical protein
MRPIDADALYEQAANTAEYYCGFFNDMENVISARDIEQAPTIDAVPVVHGKWVLITPHPSILYNHYRCSECGEMKYNKSLFCPNCGAKMDSSETDEPEINPCRGCSDYDENGGCLSGGGCAGTGGDAS